MLSPCAVVARFDSQRTAAGVASACRARLRSGLRPGCVSARRAAPSRRLVGTPRHMHIVPIPGIWVRYSRVRRSDPAIIEIGKYGPRERQHIVTENRTTPTDDAPWTTKGHAGRSDIRAWTRDHDENGMHTVQSWAHHTCTFFCHARAHTAWPPAAGSKFSAHAARLAQSTIPTSYGIVAGHTQCVTTLSGFGPQTCRIMQSVPHA